MIKKLNILKILNTICVIILVTLLIHDYITKTYSRIYEFICIGVLIILAIISMFRKYSDK